VEAGAQTRVEAEGEAESVAEAAESVAEAAEKVAAKSVEEKAEKREGTPASLDERVSNFDRMQLNLRKISELHYYQTVSVWQDGKPLHGRKGLAVQAAPDESADGAACILRGRFPKQTAYTIVGIPKERFPTSRQELRKLMRRAFLRNHPDKGGDKDWFHLVNFTFEMLMDPVRKRLYDVHGWAGGFRDPVHFRGQQLRVRICVARACHRRRLVRLVMCVGLGGDRVKTHEGYREEGRVSDSHGPI
jgi:hypothetical protein